MEDLYPLSPMQKGLLFHSLYAPEQSIYFGHMACRLTGELNEMAFRRAWESVLDRHAILRTYFVWEGVKEPVQVVCRQVPLPWKEEDWRGLSNEQQAEKLRAFLEQDRRQGLNPGHAPLLRFALFRTGDKEYEFIWSHHHLLLDGWSMPLLMKEMSALYKATIQGKQVDLARPRPYRDYIAWLQRQDEGRAKAFWEGRLKGFRMPTPLPKVGSGNEDDGERIEYAEEQLRLSEDVTAQLRKFTRRHQVTLNTVIQGVWGLLLSRYSGQSDVVFGAVVSGRPAELQGVERMIGLFINTLPVRIQIDKNQMIVDWLRQIQREQVEAREFEYSPLVDIQGWSELPRGTPLFNTLVAFLNYPVQMTPGSPHSAHRRGNILRVERKFIPELTNYPLALSVWPDATLPLRCVYQTVLYDAGTIRRLLSHLKRVLEPACKCGGFRGTIHMQQSLWRISSHKSCHSLFVNHLATE